MWYTMLHFPFFFLSFMFSMELITFCYLPSFLSLSLIYLCTLNRSCDSPLHRPHMYSRGSISDIAGIISYPSPVSIAWVYGLHSCGPSDSHYHLPGNPPYLGATKLPAYRMP
jgi:hypothetical protein